MRKFFLLLLLIAGCALIFSPLLPGIFSSQAHPSNRPLPQPWKGKPKIELNQPAAPSSPNTAAIRGLPATGAACGETYTIQDGDTLGEVANSCGITLAELLNANPGFDNPNRIFTGQQIILPDPQAGRGGGDLLAVSAIPAQAGGFQPGGKFTIGITGLPPKTPVRVGLGLSVTGYSLLSETQTDTNGRLSLILRLPEDAQQGETGFVLVTTIGVPSEQRVSDNFTIGTK